MTYMREDAKAASRLQAELVMEMQEMQEMQGEAKKVASSYEEAAAAADDM